MKTNRLEAFSDGVIAIVITIMILEMKVPSEPSRHEMWAVWPQFLSYVLSFIMIAIYWVNHHHLIHLVRVIDGPMLWANLLLLFCISLLPFVTAHLGQSHAAPYATTAYVLVALASGLAYYLLRHLIERHDRDNPARAALHCQMRRKNLVAVSIYVVALAFSFISVPIALGLVVLPAAMYFVPFPAAPESAKS